MEAVKAEQDEHQKRGHELEALERSLGIVTTACNAVGVGRTTHYQWMKDDPEYRDAVKGIENRTLDFAESHLHKLYQGRQPRRHHLLLEDQRQGARVRRATRDRGGRKESRSRGLCLTIQP